MPTPIPFLTFSADSRARAISVVGATIYSYSVRNENAYPVYIKLYNALPANVTTATVPAQILTIPAADANGAGVLNNADVTLAFATAISARCTTINQTQDTTNPAASVTLAVDLVAAGGAGSLPNQSGQNGKFLTTDGTTASWGSVVAGGGDVTGPGSSTDGEIALFNLATGKAIKASGIVPTVGIGTFLTTPSSANLRTALTDETGSGPAVFATAPTVTDLGVGNSFSLAGALTPPALTGQVDNYAPTSFATAMALRLDGGAANRDITGIAGGVTGRMIQIVNIGTTNNLTLKEASGSSTAGNRFILGADLVIAPKQAVTIRYDGTDNRWRPFSYLNGTGLPVQSGNAGKFLETDGTIASWATIAAGGDVSAAAPFGTDNAVVRSDGTAKGVQTSGISVDDSNNLSGVNTFSTTDSTTNTLRILDSIDQSHGLGFVVATDLIADKSFTFTGAFNYNMILTGNTAVTFPVSGTLQSSDFPLTGPGLANSGATKLSGINTPTTLSGDVNDYNPAGLATSSILRIDPGGANRNVSGIVAQAAGTILEISNISATAGRKLVLRDRNGSSASANQFFFVSDVEISAGKSVAIWYDGTTAMWRPFGRALANTGVTAASYGSATQSGTFTVSADGTITAAANVAILLTPSGAGLGSVTNDVQTKAAIVPNTAPGSGQILVGTGSAYAPVTLSGDATINSSGVLSALGNYVLHGGSTANNALANSTTYYYGSGQGLGVSSHTTYANCKIRIPRSGTITNVHFHAVIGTNGTGESVAHSIRLNDTTDTVLNAAETYNPGANTSKEFDYTTSIGVTAGDFVTLKIVTPAWATPPTLVCSDLTLFIS